MSRQATEGDVVLWGLIACTAASDGAACAGFAIMATVVLVLNIFCKSDEP